MKLPNWENAYIPSEKVEDYLLSETHPIGRFKARVFLAAGFDRSDARTLEQGLLAIAHLEEVTEVIPSPYGVKYIVEGAIASPMGTILAIVTVWIIDSGQNAPRFVTTYPR